MSLLGKIRLTGAVHSRVAVLMATDKDLICRSAASVPHSLLVGLDVDSGSTLVSSRRPRVITVLSRYVDIKNEPVAPGEES